MMLSCRAEQRRDVEAFADGLRGWLRGDDALGAEAAGLNLAEILILWGKSMTDNKWG
jgi:hypothetical protein